jgi:hypothetical protein
MNWSILNISLDTDYNKWKKGVTNLGIGEMINICDLQSFKGKIAQDYFIKSIPANYLISEKGEVILKRISIEEIKNELNKYSP